MRTLRFLAPGAALLIAACAAPIYRPYSHGVGYAEVHTARQRYEVSFQGPSGMSPTAAKRYAIVRAAEIGLRQGYPHFRLASSRTGESVTRQVVTDPELFPRDPWSPERRRLTWWEAQRERELQRSRTRVVVENRPLVTLTVEYSAEDCEDCLSVEATLREAEAEGLLRR